MPASLTPISSNHWIAFILGVLILLVLDLGLFNKKDHVMKTKEAIGWTAFWVGISLSFGGYIFYNFGSKLGTEWFSGYLLEQTLSVDNIFVFILIFKAFKVPSTSQHRVLFWGILGAMAMRAVFILAGIELVTRFHSVLYFFGLILLFTAIKVLREKDEAEDVDFSEQPLTRFVRKIVPMTDGYRGNRFWVYEHGKWMGTPLLLAVLVIEMSDLIFAVDSIPAVFGVTADPYVAFTSNICAVLGLRSMYFLLAAVVPQFEYLGKGIGLILLFVAIKMLLPALNMIPGLEHAHLHVPTPVSLFVIVLLLVGSIVLSILHKNKHQPKA